MRKRKVVLVGESVIAHIDGWVCDPKRLAGLHGDYQVANPLGESGWAPKKCCEGVIGCGAPVLLTKGRTFKQTRKLKTNLSMTGFCKMLPALLGTMGIGGKADFLLPLLDNISRKN